MKYLKYFALVAVLMVPLAYAQAEVSVGIDLGVTGPPVCAYGYYPYYPYACAPYGYYGPSWFVGGIFIGAGPWYHGWGRPYYPGFGYYHGPVIANHGFVNRGPEGHGGGFHGGPVRGGGFHGGGGHGGGHR